MVNQPPLVAHRYEEREYWNSRREASEAKQGDALRAARAAEEAQRRKVLSQLRAAEQRATDSRLEREKAILREKRRREEKAAAAKERIRRVAEEKEARRRQLVRSFVCPVIHSSIRRSFFTVQSLPVTFIPPLHTKRRLPRRRRR